MFKKKYRPVVSRGKYHKDTEYSFTVIYQKTTYQFTWSFHVDIGPSLSMINTDFLVNYDYIVDKLLSKVDVYDMEFVEAVREAVKNNIPEVYTLH